EFNIPPTVIEKTIQVLSTQKSGYSAPLGLPKLRELLAQKFNQDNDVPANGDNIIITPGTKQALQFILMSILEPQDEIIILMPAFVSFIPQVYIAEPRAKVVEIDI